MAKKLSYILIPLIMLGIFLAPLSPVIQKSPEDVQVSIEKKEALAQATTPGYWWLDVNTVTVQLFGSPTTYGGILSFPPLSGGEAKCREIEALIRAQGFGSFIVRGCFQNDTPQVHQASGGDLQDPATKATLDNYLRSCGDGVLSGGNLVGCFLQIMYFFLVSIPSWLLAMTATMFNYLAALTLSDTMYTAPFIQKIWTVVRDFSNIFFILILLYAAFQIILGLGGGGGKKIVASVILVALLVNFSLFITKVVIDSSNVLALIFYNKIDCKQTDGSPCKSTPTSDASKTGIKEKELAGALVSKFEINTFFNAEFFKDLENDPKNWRNANRIGSQATAGSGVGTLDNALALALMVTYAFIIYPLAWVFLVTGLSFLGRMLMLMMLMIVGPLAFVSASVPKFSNVDTIGFNSWIKKLLETSFVATVFMAILYLVSEMMNSNIFTGFNTDTAKLDVLQRLLVIFIPAIMIVVLLKKGSSYAQKASGEFTGMILSGVKKVGMLAGGIGIGAAVGAVAAGGRATVGRLGSAVSQSTWVKDNYATSKVARMLYSGGKKAGSASFDARKVTIAGKGLSSTGLKGLDSFGKAKEGGFTQARKDKKEKRLKRAEELKVGEDEAVKQRQNQVEGSHQELLTREGSGAGAHEIKLLEDRIKIQTANASDASRQARTNGNTTVNPSTGRTYQQDAIAAENALKDSKGERQAMKDASIFLTSDGRLIDHRTNTTNENLSETAIPAIERAFNAANHAAEQAPIQAREAYEETAIGQSEAAVTTANTNVVDRQNEVTTTEASLRAAILAFENNRDAARAPALDQAMRAAETSFNNATAQYNDAVTAQAVAVANHATVSADAGNIAERDRVVEAGANNVTTANNNLVITTAALDTARATQAQHAVNNANPADANYANLQATAQATQQTAQASQTALENLATANPEDEHLAQANQAAADALTRIAAGLSGRSINNLEDTDIPNAHHDVESVTKARQRELATLVESGENKFWNFVSSFGQHSSAGANESAHAIRMGAKVDSGSGGKGGGH